MKSIKSVKEFKPWREFKAKWDGNIPGRKAPNFQEYREDAEQITKLVEIFMTSKGGS